ncbi:MAG: hypothetical protein WC549_09440 [Actinomycetota bacterium]
MENCKVIYDNEFVGCKIKTEHYLNDYPQENPTRKYIADLLSIDFPKQLVTIGGHHVALHDEDGNRICIVIHETANDFN